MSELVELTIKPPLVGHVTAELISERWMEVVFDGVGRRVAIRLHPDTDVAAAITGAISDAKLRWAAEQGEGWRPTQRDVVNRTKVRVLRPGWEGKVGTVFWAHPSGDRMRVYTDTNPSMLLLSHEAEPVLPSMSEQQFVDTFAEDDDPDFEAAF